MRSSFSQVSTTEFVDIANQAGIPLPVEQTDHWDRFDGAIPGREPWVKFVWMVDGEPAALISLTHFEGRGFTYLWAKHGPVWLLEPTSTMEEQFRDGLCSVVKVLDKKIAFIRLHASPAPGLEELLQTVTYDRTVILDLRPDDDERMASMKKRGRRDVRKALRQEGLVAADETDRAETVFPELYQLLVETGERDEFGILPQENYIRMLTGLGPDHARLYTIRKDGVALCWGIVVVNETLAEYYYAASGAEGRKLGAPDMLVWEMGRMLRERGVEFFDLMGIDSERAPQLAGVRNFKTKFSEEIAEIPGAWDVPVRPRFYAALKKALHLKRSLSTKLKR